MILSDQMKLIEDLIDEDPHVTLGDYLAFLKELEAIKEASDKPVKQAKRNDQ